MISDLNKIAGKIVEQNQYLTLGTINKDCTTWVSPVAYAYDHNFHFYFISLPSSKHSQNITKNPKVSFAIFDSHQVFGEGVGLQIEGTTKLVSLTQLPQAISAYISRDWPFINNKIKTYLVGSQKVLENLTYKVYQITPIKIWMNDPNTNIDVRVEVKLT